MTALICRRWSIAAAIVLLIAATSIGKASPPESGVTVAAVRLPITSRTIRLRNERETPAVVTAIAADPRGELVAAAGDDFVIRVLHAATLKTLHLASGHRDLVRTLTFDPTGEFLISAGNDGQLMVWDREHDFRLKRKWSGTPALTAVACAPDGREFAAVGFENRVYILGGQRASRPHMECACNDLRAVAYRADKQVLAVGGRSGVLYLFQPQTGQRLGIVPLHDGRIGDIAFLDQSELIVCVGEDGQLTVFDSAQQALVHRVQVTTSKLFAVAAINPQLVAVAVRTT